VALTTSKMKNTDSCRWKRKRW